MHARLVSTIRSPSACSSMSSHTHPQNVQVAFFTTVREAMRWFRARVSFLGGAGRTGRRDDEGSPQFAAAEAAADPAGHEPPRLDLLPRPHLAAVGRLF